MTHPGPALYQRIYDGFQAPVSRFDCGRKCAPHNGGEPVCCSTAHAIPVVDRGEWELLESRTRLWHLYEPRGADGREAVADLHPDCRAIECKGARSCERDNRALSCRTFPFFPYITRAGDFVGLAYYWTFEDRCWVISNLAVVDPGFVREFVAAHDLLFHHDPEELEALREHSAIMRRVFTRWRRIIPLIGRDGGTYAVEPVTHAIRPASLDEFPRHGPYAEELPAVGEALTSAAE
jgi:hypothetical protein